MSGDVEWNWDALGLCVLADKFNMASELADYVMDLFLGELSYRDRVPGSMNGLPVPKVRLLRLDDYRFMYSSLPEGRQCGDFLANSLSTQS